MDDLISRQAAIEAMTDKNIVENMDSVIDTELHRCKRAVHRIIAKIPSAQKQGKWVSVENDLDYYPFMCSVCYETVTRKTDFCPNCGAKMERSKE